MKYLIRASFISAALFLAAAVLSIPTQRAEAQGLVIAPLSIQLSDRERSVAVRLYNSTDEQKRYDIEFVNRVMDENATLSIVEEDFEYSSAPLLRYAPRRLTIGPGEQRALRVMYRRNPNFAPGDYHTHMRFSEVPLTEEELAAAAAARALEAVDENDNGLSVEIETKVAISVPVVVSVGSVNSELAITGGRVTPSETPGETPASLQIDIARSGNAHGAGLLRGEYIDSGKPAFESAIVKVYRERETVSKSIELLWPDEKPVTSGKVRVFLHAGETPDTDVIGMTEINIGNAG